MVKVAVVLPDETTTLGGVVAVAVLELDSVTVVPPAGADALKVTVPVAEAGPMTEVGEMLKLERDCARHVCPANVNNRTDVATSHIQAGRSEALKRALKGTFESTGGISGSYYAGVRAGRRQSCACRFARPRKLIIYYS